MDTRIGILQEAEDNYYLTANYLLQLSKQAYELFVSSEMEQKRQLLKLLLQNPELDGKIVRYDLIKPFDTILNYANHQRWLPNHKLLISPNIPNFDLIIKAFQNVVYMGELRQRWLEIKKLMRQPNIVAVKVT